MADLTRDRALLGLIVIGLLCASFQSTAKADAFIFNDRDTGRFGFSQVITGAPPTLVESGGSVDVDEFALVLSKMDGASLLSPFPSAPLGWIVVEPWLDAYGLQIPTDLITIRFNNITDFPKRITVDFWSWNSPAGHGSEPFLPGGGGVKDGTLQTAYTLRWSDGTTDVLQFQSAPEPSSLTLVLLTFPALCGAIFYRTRRLGRRSPVRDHFSSVP